MAVCFCTEQEAATMALFCLLLTSACVSVVQLRAAAGIDCGSEMR